jgi:predicted adenylyl cyclase CyaB
MPQNLELKARLSSIHEAERIARRINAHARGVLRQRDIYYNVPHGRLKLRIINNRTSEIIYYNRPDKKQSRYSEYLVLPVQDAALSNALFTAAFGLRVIVEKKRRLFLYKNCRIHLDEVHGLGTFIEFEVLVNYGKRQARQLFDFISTEFKVSQSSRIAGSYSDLILKGKHDTHA